MSELLGSKILVIGSPGAGKSHFSGLISEISGIELFHLDRLYWLPGWVPVHDTEFDQRLDIVLSGEKWIIDGNYQRTLNKRYEAADTILYLDFNRYLCLYRSIKRTIANKETRTDITEGCEEHLNLEFLKWIWNYPSRNRDETMELLKASKGKKIRIFRKPSQLEGFVKELRDAYSSETMD